MGVKPRSNVDLSGGAHNRDLAASAGRILRGTSWRQARVIVVMPAADTIPTKVAFSHWCLGFPPNQGVYRHLALGEEVGAAYSTAITEILAHPDLSKWEYLLTIEHDNAPPSDGVVKLIERMQANPDFACIGGLYWTKGEGGVPQIWGDVKDPALNFRPQAPDPQGGLVECHGTGMGFNLWRLSMFKDERLRRPWFKTGDGCTQDLYFWSDARKWGYRCAIDCSVKVGHYDHEGKYGPPGTMW